MTKMKSTKRSLIMSALSLLMCVSMFIGSTFAWFTDTVTSGGNKIVAGNLDIALEMWDGEEYTDISDSTEPIFGTGSIAQNNNAETLWEPGKTQVAYLKLVNNGSLDLKYKVNINVTNSTKELYEVMQYTITPDAVGPEGVTTWDTTKAVDITSLGIAATQATEVALEVGAVHYFALSVHMKEEATNEYQGGTVDFDIIVNATQLASEEDSFNETYDKDAVYAVNAFASAPVVANGATIINVFEDETSNVKVATVTVPAAAVADDVEEIQTFVVETTVDERIDVASDEKAVTFDVTVTGLKEGNTTPVKVELFVGKGLSNVVLYHNDEQVTNASYNSASGYVIFESTSFSPFTVVYDVEVVQPDTPGSDEQKPADLPTAIVEDADEFENVTLEWNAFGPVIAADANQQLESVYVFKAQDTSETVNNSPYKDWLCDYYVSMDKEVAKEAVFLGGNYGDYGWVGFKNPEAIEANTEVALLSSVTDSPLTYKEIVNMVGEFICGVAHLDASLEGATFTVKLRLTNPKDETEYYDVNTVNYTFGKPADLPVAEVADADQYENTAITWGQYDAWSPSNENQQLESAYIFTAQDTSETVENSPYKDWYCDYYVSMNKAVAENTVFLGGNYGSFGWVGFENPIAIEANEEVALLGSVTSNPWTYEQIVKSVGEFICGVAHLDSSLDGATFTVKLRLTNPDNESVYYDVNTVEYTFGELATE